jgi:hypothetical protein
MTIPLFDGIPDSDPPAAEPAPKLSTDRRRTLKRQALLDAGIHPRTRLPLAGNGKTCGDCAHSELHYAGSATHGYWKCLLAGVTSGPGTDIRKSWPACTAYKPTQES